MPGAETRFSFKLPGQAGMLVPRPGSPGAGVVDPNEGRRMAERAKEAVQELRRFQEAERAIKRTWVDLHGPASKLGLPLDGGFALQQVNGGYQAEFRGGTLKVMDNDPDKVLINADRQVVVTFEGYGLEMRQEKGDEIYGHIAAKIGSTGYQQTFDIPIADVGPGDDDRVRPYAEVLWDGPPADINIVAKMFEHDDGDSEKIRAEIRARVKELFDKVGQVAAGGLPGVGLGGAGDGVDDFLEGLRGESQSNDSLVNWLLGGIGDGITKLLGLGDDDYNAAGFTIFAKEMMNLPPAKTYRCWNDPRVIEYTHAVTVDSYDDAGDHGRLTLLFRVRPK